MSGDEPNHAEILALLQEALAHHQAGRRDSAEPIYRRVIAKAPDHPDALNLLGALLEEMGRLAEAESMLRRAVAVSPGQAAAHFNLANVLRRADRCADAVDEWARAAELSVDFAFEAHINRATTLFDTSAADAAIAAVRAAAAVVPVEVPAALEALAKIAEKCGDLSTAIDATAELARRNPQRRGLTNELGRLLFRAGRLTESRDAFREAVAETSGKDAAVLLNLAQVIGSGASDELSEGVAAAARAIELRPTFADAHETMASLMRSAGRPSESAASARRAIALRPPDGSPRAHHALGNAMFDLGRADEAIAAYRAALSLDPSRALTHGSLLMTLDYASDADPKRILEEHVKWGDRFAPVSERAPLRTSSEGAGRGEPRRIRVGYISPDFRKHPVALFFEPLLRHHDRDVVDVFLYSNVRAPDEITARFRSLAGDERFRGIVGLNDDQAAQLIRADGIDILVDLAGHTADNRLLVLARRPAPVQMTYIGYWNTTGMRGVVDYRITDDVNDPAGGSTEQFWVEKLLRVEGGAWCFEPPANRPEVSPPPVLSNGGRVTLLAPHKPIKTSDAMLRLWRRILDEAPSARLIVVTGGNEERANEILAEGLSDPGRVELLPRMTPQEYYRLFDRADLVLDVAPHNGHTVGCDALWQGVPVLTLTGPNHASRLTASVLTSAGLDQEGLICTSPDEYVTRARELGGEADLLGRLRGTMRDRLLSSNLMDGKRLARGIERCFATITASRSASPSNPAARCIDPSGG